MNRPSLSLGLISAFLACAILGACEELEEEPINLIADLEIGLSVDGEEFIETDHGTDALLEYGAQGGMHLFTMPRFRGVSGIVHLEREARLVDTGLLVLRSPITVLELPETADDNWWHQSFALSNFMCPTPVGITIYDREIEFSYKLRNRDGELLATDSLILIPRCPSSENGEFCHSVCSGN